MRKLSRPVKDSPVGLLAVIGVIGLLAVVGIVALLVMLAHQPKPVEATPVQTPTSATQKSVKVNDMRKPQTSKEYQTGWSQLEDSIEISLSGPIDCQPEIEKAIREYKTVRIWLKDQGDDCSSEASAITYSTIEDSKDIEEVEVFEAGYDYSFPLHKKE